MRWTRSDTIGFVIAAAILVVPPIFVMRYLDDIRKPGQPPTPLEIYLLTASFGLVGAVICSAIAWRWGGSEQGRWAIHGLVASVVLVTYVISCCFWAR